MNTELHPFESEDEAAKAGTELIAAITTPYPWLAGMVRCQVGQCPVSGRATLTLWLKRNTSYPLDVSGLVGFRGNRVTVRYEVD